MRTASSKTRFFYKSHWRQTDYPPLLSIAGLGIAFRAKPIVKESAKQSLNTLGLDGILFLMGLSERETRQQERNLSDPLYNL